MTATKLNSNPSTRARQARQKRRNWVIAGLAGLATAISVLSPAAPASAHAEDRVSVSTTVQEFAPVKATGYTADQFFKWDKARTTASTPALQTPPTTPSDPGGTIIGSKQLAPTRQAPGKASYQTTTTTTYQAQTMVAATPGSASVGGGDKIIANQGTVGSLSDCHIDFDEKSVLNILPDHAQATFVYWPFWLEACNGSPEGNITVRPQEAGHYHLGYEDLQISFCSDIGNFGRHTEPRPVDPTDDELLDWYYTPCTEIDPVAETRSAIQPHSAGYTTEIFAYESFGDKLPMTLNSIQIVSGTSELCYLGTGDWIAEEAGESPWQCMDLGPGHWNMSGIADDVIEVRVTALTANNVIDNIAADIL